MTLEPTPDGYGVVDASPDDPLAGAVVQAAGGASRTHPWHGLLRWSGTSAPVALLLVSGIALGPSGINLVSTDVLSVLAPVVSVALAGLGVLVGLSVGLAKADGRTSLACLGIDAALTLSLVSGGLAMLASAGSWPPSVPQAIAIVGAGICAASSLTLTTGNPLEPRTPDARFTELGVLAPTVLGALMLAWFHSSSPAGPLLLTAAMAAFVCAVATAAWLLMTVASSDTDVRVLSMAALLLVGGVSDALSGSALFVGVVAGLFWRFLGRRSSETIGRDVLFLQHPLLVLVLMAAGATAELSPSALALAAAYVALRVAARLGAGALAKRASRNALSSDLGRYLLKPGVFGVAFALNATRAIGSDATLLLDTIVIGTIGSELIAFVLAPRRVAE
jgi:hypothetical protein